MTAIGSVLNLCAGGSAPAVPACDGNIPLSPPDELGATIGAAEFGTEVEDSGVDASATVVDGTAAGGAAAGRVVSEGAAAGGAKATTGPAGSADATLTGSPSGTDRPGAAAIAAGEAGGLAAPASVPVPPLAGLTSTA
jgi:hypothetical protein